MRVFAVSDIHVDYAENLDWVLGLDRNEYLEDILILAGDVSDSMPLLRQVFESLLACFKAVAFVPGNHELWLQDGEHDCSLEKLDAIEALCRNLGVHDQPFEASGISFIPLYSWYDFSFGEPDRRLRRAWRDFRACKWPETLSDTRAVSEHFLDLNESRLSLGGDMTISYSHFLPRIDVMPDRIPIERRSIYPVLGSERLGAQIERLGSDIHVYGHSHVNQSIRLGETQYVNNAFAYPKEQRIARKQLHCIYEC